MFYKITLVANLPQEPPIDWLKRIADYIKLHAITLNPGQETENRSSYQLHECHHDQQPGEDCKLLAEWESPGD